MNTNPMTIGVNVHAKDETRVEAQHRSGTAWLQFTNGGGSDLAIIATPENLERLCREALAQLEAMKAEAAA